MLCNLINTHTHTHTLWRETLGRSLGSHDVEELVGGMCHGNNGCRQETTRLHAISCTKTGWSSLTHNQVLHQALARSLRKSKVQFVVEDAWPFRERASGQNGRLNPLRVWTSQRRRKNARNCKIVVNAMWETGETFGGKRKKCRKERVGPVAANPDNLESNKEAGGEHKVLRTQVRIVRVERMCPLCRV